MPKVTAAQRDGNPKWGFSPLSYAVWTGYTILDPFSLAILGMTTVSIPAGVGHSELCPRRAFLLEEP